MDRIERVTVPVETFAPDGTTNAYLVGTSDAILVDPAAATDELAAAVEQRNVAHVLATHPHPDHVGGVAAFADEFDVTVWARAGRTDRFEQATGVTPDKTFKQDTVIETGDRCPVTVLETPGHTPDHVALSVPGRDGDTILAGDLAVADGSVYVGADEGDMRTYLTSLRRLYARNPMTILPGHGRVIDDSRKTLARLIQHRLDREAKVRAAVNNGARTLDEIVSAAYEKDLTGVRELARLTVAAHLEKLAVEDAVAWDGSEAQPA